MADLRMLFDFEVLEPVTCFIIIIAVSYWFNVSTHSFWKKRKVPGPRPFPFFGNVKEIICFKTSPAEKFRDLYFAWKHEPFIGLFQGRTPVLLVNDPELLKTILIKEFGAFTDRGVPMNEKADPLSAHLSSIEYRRWKILRQKLTPAFTPAKLQSMYCLLSECADRFEKYVDELVAKGNHIECKEMTARFTTDVIGACIFGIDMNAIGNECSEFRRIGQDTFNPSVIGTMRRIFRELSPQWFKLFQVKVFPDDLTHSFLQAFTAILAYRRQNNHVIRNDFLDLLMKIRNTLDQKNFELTDELAAAQAFFFFAAGFETSALTMTFALYELALNQTLQERLRMEIQDTLKKFDGKIPYEALRDMKYLDKVFRETLRKHPPMPLLTRVSNKNCTIPGTQVHIPAGTKIFISLLGLHYDPQYYPNPEVFDPERFDDEALQKRPQMAYLPFGIGPRNCIGARFANNQTKMGLITILKNHEVSTCKMTKIPYTIDRHALILAAVGGIHLNFNKLR